VVFDKNKVEVCEVCYRAKQTRNRFPISRNIAKCVFGLIHCNVWGPYRESSSCGGHYFRTIVDNASRRTWVYLMSDRGETSQLLKDFIIMAKNQFGHNVKIIRSDNGSQFTSKPMQKYHEHGTLRQSSCVDTPQQHGQVERKHRHVLNVARALLFQASLPTKFWVNVCLRQPT